MHRGVRIARTLLAGCGLLAVLALVCNAQQGVSIAKLPAPVLPDVPIPAETLAAPAPARPAQTRPASAEIEALAEARNEQTAITGAASQSSSGSQNSGSNPDSGSGSQTAQPAGSQKAKQQLKAEEKQRVLGIVPNFGTSYVWNAASLSATQKIQLAFRSAVDPFTFAAAGLVAGLHEALNDDPGFGWGAAGYGKRAGAAYLDAFDGDMLASGFLPALLHQDPRYFRLGHGTFTHRLFYAMAATVIARRDKSGKWEPNYSNIGGNIAAGALSNFYYPHQNSGWGQTLANGFIVTAEGTAGGIFAEFWPDISRKLLHRDPDRGAE